MSVFFLLVSLVLFSNESLGWTIQSSVASSAFKLSISVKCFEWYNFVHPRFFWSI
ncbi:uncharacterized protein J3R85_004034 [Psidium guajava]|nr:uncharacterized protein J3R85_004034 [Psidium guajava]